MAGGAARTHATARIVDAVWHELIGYRAKDFDSQRSYRITFEIKRNVGRRSRRALVETGVYLHWCKGVPVDVAIDLSCMSGCTEHCIFCAAAELDALALTAEEILMQAEKALQAVAAHEADFLDSFEDKPKLTFSFEGMGEPSRRPGVIIDAIGMLRQEFGGRYNTQFIVSTTAVVPESLRTWARAGLDLHSLQFSLHAADEEKRREFFEPLDRNESLEAIFAALDEFHAACPQTQIKVNYLLLGGRNDMDADVAALLALLGSKPYYLKISRLNETEPAIRRGLRSPTEAELETFFAKVAAGRPPGLTYVYGSTREIQVSCGQLASYARRLGDEERRAIRNIYRRILDGHTILFLGAGASWTLPDSQKLAEEFWGDLDYGVPFESTGLTVREVIDLYEAQDRRHEVDRVIQQRMAGATYPPEFLLLTLFPWKAIYTTNYDQFVERAYADAERLRLSEKRCVPVLKTADLAQPATDKTVRLVKLHGCISQGVGSTILSGADYLADYREVHGFLFKMLETDALSYDVVFAGYSFRDEYVGSLLATLKVAAGAGKTAAYAVLPPSAFTADQRKVLHKNFSVTLIPATFGDFLDELARLARQPNVFISGSSRPEILGGIKRLDFKTQIEEFAAILGKEFDDESVRVVTGATATDKLGYLVGSHMDASLVTTYHWEGAGRIDDPAIGDEPAAMINVRKTGFTPSDVVETMARIAQFAVFVGGGRLALQEFYELAARGRLVIPVALGDSSYTSDLIHSIFLQNASSIDRLNADEGLAKKEPGKHEPPALTHDQLDRLHLGQWSPRDVADTVMEIVRDYRYGLPEADLGTVARQ
jgi:adenine C2-methylase RlmN of 23S rRNA A2503 and tRNA A37